MGVRGEIPWIPQVYDKKEKAEKDETFQTWEDKAEDLDGDSFRTNYKSATSHLPKVKKRNREEEERKGWIKRLPLKEAKRIYQGDLQIASLGAVPKDIHWEEIRVVHDGTHGISTNLSISQPVPVQKEDWALQSFMLDDPEEVFVNMVATFGVASAAFWWGRVASVVFRVFHRVLPQHLLFYFLLFADDGLLLSAGPEYHKTIVALFMFLDIMEVPLSWRKTCGGFRVEWIGYTLELDRWQVGVSEKKVQWLVQWALKMIEEGRMLGREFKAGVGRLGFLAGAISGVLPFLAPLYAISSRVGGSTYVEMHMAVKLAISFFSCGDQCMWYIAIGYRRSL